MTSTLYFTISNKDVEKTPCSNSKGDVKSGETAHRIQMHKKIRAKRNTDGKEKKQLHVLKHQCLLDNALKRQCQYCCYCC